MKMIETQLDRSKGWPVDVWLPSPIRIMVQSDSWDGEHEAEAKVLQALNSVGADIQRDQIATLSMSPVEFAEMQGWTIERDESGAFVGMHKDEADE